MDLTAQTTKLELVGETDARLSHLQHPGFKLGGPAYNYVSALAPILTHTLEVVHIYNFDGELDDQLRLEHLLLVWTGTTPLIIIAGERNGGGETLDEMKAIVRNQIRSPSFLQRIHVIAGTCLKAESPGSAQRSRQCVQTLIGLIKGRPFVWHNNTTMTLLAVIIQHPFARFMKAVTTTCSILFQSAGLGTAFNRKGAPLEYEKVLQFCKQRNIPFLELQLKLAGWKTDTFAILPGWAETMCKPVASLKVQKESQQVMHQGMGFAFAVALMAYQATNNMTFEEIHSYAQDILRAHNMQESVWAHWPSKSVGMWNGVTLDSAAARFTGMQQNTRMPLSNTIGDVTGAIVDSLHVRPAKNDKLIILKIHQRHLAEGKEAWRLGRGGSPSSTGGHFAVVYANEDESLGKAWSRIQASRKTAPASISTASYELIDTEMVQQWMGFCAVMVPLLQSVQTKIHRFKMMPSSSKQIAQTLDNLKNGEMARLCSASISSPSGSISRSNSASSKSWNGSTVPSSKNSRRTSASSSRRSSLESQKNTGSASSRRSSVERDFKRISSSSDSSLSSKPKVAA